ncbi:MAG: DEAD/DEAH box helicase, partial [Spirochaetales bacterium]|nr:DEAD/DEAH box helicase [Spirochaetales bacterium]
AFLLQVENERKKRPILIVVPKSLIFNWSNEIDKFCPYLTYGAYYGNNRDISIFSQKDIVITTYHTLRNDIETIKNINFFYTVLDEIQSIKNHTSKIAKSAFLLKSQYRLGMSGTPLENSMADLYSISRFLNPTLFGTFKKFKEEWFAPIYSDDSKIVTSILRHKLKPLFLRRVKDDVLTDLPPKTEQVIFVDMDERQKSLYEKTRKNYHDKIRLKIRDEGVERSQLTIIKAFMELRQIATVPEVKTSGSIISPKVEVVLEQLLETVSGGNKVLIFSNFLGSIKTLSNQLINEGIEHRIITGATNKRESIIEEFIENRDIKVLIMTLKTGGVGLNLTAASYVYILDPWWNLSAETQAIDRTHRIGQLDPVFCYRFISRGSIEEKILQLHGRKRVLFENLFNRAAPEKSLISEDDIEYLLG